MVLSIVSIVAVIVAPIVSVWIAQHLHERSDKRKDKIELFKTLMMSRNGWTVDSVRALNILDIVFSDDKYTQIQKELTQLEQAKEVFCIRMGDNLSNKEGSGNFIYNLSTGQFDVNISNDDTWTDMEKISHELKHADQYLNRKLTFLISVSGIVTIEDYSVDDEIEAFNRQSMFGKSLSYNEIHNAYPELNHYGKNSSFIPTQEYIIINTTYNQGKKHPYKLYHGWENDLIK